MTGSCPLRVVLADDHGVVLSGLTALLSLRPRLEVVAAVSDGAAALDCIRATGPDLAILDINMPGLTGIDVLERLHAERFTTKVILLTASANDSQIARALVGGAWGVMLKESAADALFECIDKVASGERWLPADLINPALERQAQQGRVVDALASLTPREQELVMLVAEGLSNKEIARRTHISDGTVRIHLHHIYQKLGVSNRTVLAALAHRSLGNGAG